MASTVMTKVYPGAIVLKHDGGGDRTQTLAALEFVLCELSGQGYTLGGALSIAPTGASE